MKIHKRPMASLFTSAGLGLMSTYAATVNSAVCEYTVDNQWNGGFVAAITITNDTNELINDWNVEWGYSDSQTRRNAGWNANVSGNNPYSAECISWNCQIQPGGSVSFGISGTKGSGPAEIPEVMGDICGPAMNLPPEAVISGGTSNVSTGMAVQFSGAGSSDPNGDALTYAWDFGNGDTSSATNPRYTFTMEGDYVVSLTVSDGEFSDTTTVTVSAIDVNLPPVAELDASDTSGSAPLRVCFDASGSMDPEGAVLTYSWDFGDGDSAGNRDGVCHNYRANGSYPATVTVSDGVSSRSASVSIRVGAAPRNVDNPFAGGVKYYIDPVWSAKAAGEPGGDAIADVNTAVWMDRRGAITAGLGLRGHLEEAVNQGAEMFMFVVYNLPNRDCAALASNGELRIDPDGFRIYQEEYIAVIKEIVSDPMFDDIRKVAIIEVDSLPNLVTNLDQADCAEADGPGGYRDGIRHALTELADVPNLYSYVDVAHSGWLGWSSNFGPAVDLIGEVVESTDQGWGSIAGFVTNSANYTPVTEPFIPDPALSFGGMPVRSASFYEWNDYLEEKAFAQDWREAMIARGAPETIGMLIDTGRNGWGGPNRPTKASESTDIDTFVDESRIDRRLHRGNWCNQPGGVGYKPFPNPYPGIDAFVWVKPQGESDGISDPNFEVDPDDPNKQHDGMCDPNANNVYNNAVTTGAIDNAPHAGRWFPEAFKILLDNAYPPANEAPRMPDAPPPPPSDCIGLDQNSPLVIMSGGGTGEVDLRCEAPIWVRVPGGISQGMFIDNTGDEYNVNIIYNGNTQNFSGYFSGTGISGVELFQVERVDKARSVELRVD